MLTGTSLILYLCVICVSAIILGSTGFAFSIFAMMFMPSLFPSYPQAVAVSSLLSCLSAFIIVTKEYRHIKWKNLFPCVFGYLFTAPVAIHLSTQLEKGLLTKLLGAFLALLGLYFIFLGGKIRIRPTVGNGIAAGALSGIGGGFFAVGAPPLVVYFLSSLDSKEAYIATLQMYMVCTCIYANIVRVLNGIFTYELIFPLLAGFVALAVGTVIGHRIMKRLPIDKLKMLIYLIMILSGVKMLLGF